MAEALTGAAVTASAARYTRQEGAIRLRSGETVPSETLLHLWIPTMSAACSEAKSATDSDVMSAGHSD